MACCSCCSDVYLPQPRCTQSTHVSGQRDNRKQPCCVSEPCCTVSGPARSCCAAFVQRLRCDRKRVRGSVTSWHSSAPQLNSKASRRTCSSGTCCFHTCFILMSVREWPRRWVSQSVIVCAAARECTRSATRSTQRQGPSGSQRQHTSLHRSSSSPRLASVLEMSRFW